MVRDSYLTILLRMRAANIELKKDRDRKRHETGKVLNAILYLIIALAVVEGCFILAIYL